MPRLAIPAIIVAIGAVVCLALIPVNNVQPFNFDIDFLGGTTFQYDLKQNVESADLDAVSNIIEQETGVRPAAPQRASIGAERTETGVLVKTTAQVSAESRDKILNALQESYPDVAVESIEFVGSSVGETMRNSAIMAIIVALFGILLYITFRFQFSSGVAAIVGLTHDILFVIAAYAIFRIPVNMTTIAVLLTVLAYSLNDNIVVFDRVRENRKVLQKLSFGDVLDRSIWQTITRNINTSLTTFFPLICLIVISVTTVREFSIPLVVGVAAGTFSSIYLVGPVWDRIRSVDKKATKKMEDRSKA
jgi:preprotein translocase subunit SecF